MTSRGIYSNQNECHFSSILSSCLGSAAAGVKT